MKGWELLNVGASLRRLTKNLATNLLLIAGVAALGYGLWQLDPRWAKIIIGVLLLAAAIVKGSRNGKSR